MLTHVPGSCSALLVQASSGLKRSSVLTRNERLPNKVNAGFQPPFHYEGQLISLYLLGEERGQRITARDAWFLVEFYFDCEEHRVPFRFAPPLAVINARDMPPLPDVAGLP